MMRIATFQRRNLVIKYFYYAVGGIGMIKKYDGGVFYTGGKIVSRNSETGRRLDVVKSKEATISYKILKEHNQHADMQHLRLTFDALASHDITYVGIIQTARASGLEKFSKPYILTNCHNSLCAVGGTINEDDHIFGLSAAKKYGGIYVPAHQAVIHQFMREEFATCGKMIMGSDSHTRYGALGTMAIGEGGGEIAKQLLDKTYDIDYPDIICVYLTGEVSHGVGPHDVALEIIKATFADGYVKNAVMEFIGDGLEHLSAEFRIGIDVMTTETTCLSSIWATDEKIETYLATHGRKSDYEKLQPEEGAYYDGCVYVDLSKIKPNIALPFHPSNVYSIAELKSNMGDIFAFTEKRWQEEMGEKIDFSLSTKISDGNLLCSQAVIAGCAGGLYENIVAAADILRKHDIGNDAFSLSVYPASQPIMYALTNQSIVDTLMLSGATMRTAFCGPCFGAGDVPGHQGLSIRHTTRNFPNREGSKPSEGQYAAVALMDARSIAATSVNKGMLTGADEIDVDYTKPLYSYNSEIYRRRVYNGWKNPRPQEELIFGPNITDWPAVPPLSESLLLKVVSVILDPVTTTDELIPSGETSSLRSNPLKLAEYTLSRKDKGYVGRAKDVQEMERLRQEGHIHPEVKEYLNIFRNEFHLDEEAVLDIALGSTIYAVKPGDGSAREQAASSQRVLGASANIASSYATKRYRSNLINWGMIPFVYNGERTFQLEEWIYIPDIKTALQDGKNEMEAYILHKTNVESIRLQVGTLTKDEKDILLSGCLINYYK